MAQRSRLELPPLDLGDESFGQRLARLRKLRGHTQWELANRIGLIQSLVSDYERDRLRLNAEMVVRFALALDVSTDELLGLTKTPTREGVGSRRLARRLQALEKLPKRDQDALLRTIDAFLTKAS